jgi:Zn-dependent protease
MTIQQLLLLAPPILIALSFHEFAHAFVANRLGDDTAKQRGRLTLNPLAHLDPIGTIMIFIVRFGWAKPVPVNPFNLANPKRDMLWISLAGPLSNILLAFISGLLVRVMIRMDGGNPTDALSTAIYAMLLFSVQINLALAVFNILPIAPLDGSKILFGVLPRHHERKMIWLERNGPFLLIGLIVLGRLTGFSFLGLLIWPFVRFFSTLFTGL